MTTPASDKAVWVEPDRTNPRWFERFQVASWLPTGEHNGMVIDRYTPTHDDIKRLEVQAWINGTGRTFNAGMFTRLYERGGNLAHPPPGSANTDAANFWMSDTADEIADHLPLFRAAAEHTPTEYGGEVLIMGLGLGMAASECLRIPGVTRVTVVERDVRVLHLVEDHLQRFAREHTKATLRIVLADAVRAKAYDLYRPPVWRSLVVWHDIWSTISSDNLPLMEAFEQEWEPWARWQGCWSKPECERDARGEIGDDSPVARKLLPLVDRVKVLEQEAGEALVAGRTDVWLTKMQAVTRLRKHIRYEIEKLGGGAFIGKTALRSSKPTKKRTPRVKEVR